MRKALFFIWAASLFMFCGMGTAQNSLTSSELESNSAQDFQTVNFGEPAILNSESYVVGESNSTRMPCVDANWSWVTEITIDNAGGNALTNFEVPLTIDTQSFVMAGEMNSDGSDIRFTEFGDPCAGMPHYIESGMNTASTLIWVNVPSIPAGGTVTIYMYHGNAGATTTSDAEMTFSFWEGFDDPTINFSTSCGSATPTVGGGSMNLSWSSNGVLISDATFPIGDVFTAEAQVDGASGNWPGIYWAEETSTENYAMLINTTQARLSVRGGGSTFCSGHNWASSLISYGSVVGIWSLTWENTGSVFGDFPTIGTIVKSTGVDYTKDENLKLNIGGISSGTGSMQVDWIRARKYAATTPTSTTGATSPAFAPPVPPVINCPMDIAVGTDAGVCGAVVNFTDAVAIDPEGGTVTVMQTAGPSSGSVFPVGPTVIEFTATNDDAPNETTTCTFTITVSDDEDPMITCQDITVDLDATGNVTVDATALVASSSDNCAIVSTEFGGSTPFDLNTGFTNGNGAAGNMFDINATNDIIVDSFDVNLEPFGGSPGAGDHEVFVYWKNGTFLGSETTSGDWTLGGSALVTSQGQNVPTPLNLNLGIPVSSGQTVGIFLVTITTSAIDYSNGGPVGDILVSDANIEVTKGVGRGQNAGNPFAGSVFQNRDVNTVVHYTVGGTGVGPTAMFDCNDVGVNPVEIIVTDSSGNTSSCLANITVQDTTAPVIVCVGEPATATGSATESTVTAIPDNDPAGTSITLSVTDDVTITDLDVNLDITHSWIGDVAVTLESPAGTVVTLVDRPGVPAGTFGCNNVDTAINIDLDDEAIDTVEDSCPEPFVGSFIPNGALSDFDGESTLGDWILTISDNAGGDTGQINSWTLNWDYDAPGTPYEVDLDANGMATVNVADLLLSVDEACGWTATATTFTSSTLSTVFGSDNGGSQGGAVYFDVTVGASDITVTGLETNTADPGAFSMEVYSLVGTYVGNEGNAGAWTLQAVASGTASGTEDVPSSATLDTPLVLSAGTTYGMALIMDASHAHEYTNGTGANQSFTDGNLTIDLGAASNAPFDGSPFSPRVWNGSVVYESNVQSTTLDLDCSNLGENLVEVTVTDPSGNTATCISTVNVNDVTDPILICQDVTIELDENGMATVVPEDLLASTPTTYNAMVIGTDNGSGTAGETDFEVAVTANETISFDWDYTTTDIAGFDGFGYVINGTFTEVTDPGTANQSGSTTVSVSAGDTFAFRVFSSDNSFGGSETLITNFQPGFEGQFAPANWNVVLNNSDGDAFFIEIPGGPLSFDACGITVLAVDIDEFSCDDIGNPVTVTVFASDASGNLASCTSVVTVVDLLGPEVTCPADQTVDPGPNNLFYVLPDYFDTGEATAADNCTDPLTIFSQDPAPGTLLSDGVYTVTLCSTDEYGNEGCCTFELTVESVLGNEDNVLANGVSIYPNPADSYFVLGNQSGVGLESARLFDMNGRLVMDLDLSGMGTERQVDVSALASGVYMVQITGEGHAAVKRLVKR